MRRRGDISLGEDTIVINLTFIFILITLVSTLIVGVGCGNDGVGCSFAKVQVHETLWRVLDCSLLCVNVAECTGSLWHIAYSLYRSPQALIPLHCLFVVSRGSTLQAATSFFKHPFHSSSNSIPQTSLPLLCILRHLCDGTVLFVSDCTLYPELQTWRCYRRCLFPSSLPLSLCLSSRLHDG